MLSLVDSFVLSSTKPPLLQKPVVIKPALVFLLLNAKVLSFDLFAKPKIYVTVLKVVAGILSRRIWEQRKSRRLEKLSLLS